MTVRVLGPVEVDGDDQLQPRDRLVLAALVARRDRAVTPEALADAVWANRPPATWTKQLQICVARLRKVLGADAIETRPGGGYRLLARAVDLDTDQLEELLERARRLTESAEPERAAAALARALAVVRGEAFQAIDGWAPARAEAARIAELVRTAEDDLLEARLAAGEHREVSSMAEEMVAREPMRERRWAALALAQYRCGRQADALRTLRRAASLLREQLGIDPGPHLVELQQRILRQDASLTVRATPPAPSGPCPYKGLAPLEAGDPFFGRDQDVADCLARLSGRRLLVVGGPSGSGKSSLVRAGIVPELVRRGRQCTLVVPDALGSLTLPAVTDGDPLVVVDQAEELFAAHRSPAAARRTCAAVASYALNRAPVLVVVRGDHLADLASDPGLGRLVEENLHLLTPMGADAVREAVERPAREAGYRCEPGLVDLVIRDVEGEPGALPLMAHSLVETWRRRDGATLTVEGYRAAGGIAGAVAQSADRLYESLPPDERQALRSVLLRLVVPQPDGEPVRCRVPLRALVEDAVRERVTARLVSARLLTAEADLVEISHEALVRAWPRLRAWLDEDAEGLRLLRHLTVTSEGWESLGRPAAELYRGARLEAAEEYRRSAHPDLTVLEHEFLDASLATATSEREELRRRARLDARRNRRLVQLLVGAVCLLLLAAGATGLAARREGEARQAAADAALQALVSRSLVLRDTDRDAAALLAVEAVRRYPGDARALSALLGTFTGSPGFVSNVHVKGVDRIAGELVPGGEMALVLLDDVRPAILDVATGRVLRELDVPPRSLSAPPGLAVSADGRRAVLVHGAEADQCADAGGRVGCAAFTVYDLPSGRARGASAVLPVRPASVVLDRHGHHIAAVDPQSNEVVVVGADDGRLVARWADRAEALVFGSGHELYVSDTRAIRRLDLHSGRSTGTWRVPGGYAGQHVDVGRDDVLVSAGPRGLVGIDVLTGRRLWTVGLEGGLPDPCPWWAVSSVVQRVYCGSHYGEIEERDRTTGQRTGTVLDTQFGDVGALAVTSDGTELVALGAQAPIVSRWRLDGSGPVSRRVADGYVAADTFGYEDATTLPVVRRPAGGTRDVDLTDFALWDTVENQVVDDLAVDATPGLAGMGWVGPGVLSGMDEARGRVRWYSTVSRRLVNGAVIGPECDHLFAAAAPGEPAFCGGLNGQVWRIDPGTLEVVPPFIQVPASNVWSVSATRGGATVVVTAWTGEGPVTTVHDGRTGEVLAGPLLGPERTAVSLDGVLFGTTRGDVTRYSLDTLRTLGDLPGARGEVNSLQFSQDGTLLLATSNDQSAALYDVATGTRLGDPIPTSAPLVYPAYLSRDGRSLAITDARGVVVWDLDADHLVSAACGLAGRNLDRTEWATYVGGPYHRTCPS